MSVCSLGLAVILLRVRARVHYIYIIFIFKKPRFSATTLAKIKYRPLQISVFTAFVIDQCNFQQQKQAVHIFTHIKSEDRGIVRLQDGLQLFI